MNCGDTGKGASRHNPASRDSAELFMSEMLRGRGYFQHGSTTERHHSLCCRIVLKTTLTAGGTPRQRRMERRPPLTFFRSSLVTMRGRQSLTAPSLLSPCSLRSRLRRPMRHGGGEERKKRFAERSLRAALPHEGASKPAVDTCCLSPVWNTGCLCGNEHCRPCRSKGTRHAQSHQHNSATERFP